jgi:hypothetical protein
MTQRSGFPSDVHGIRDIRGFRVICEVRKCHCMDMPFIFNNLVAVIGLHKHADRRDGTGVREVQMGRRGKAWPAVSQ